MACLIFRATSFSLPVELWRLCCLPSFYCTNFFPEEKAVSNFPPAVNLLRVSSQSSFYRRNFSMELNFSAEVKAASHFTLAMNIWRMCNMSSFYPRHFSVGVAMPNQYTLQIPKSPASFRELYFELRDELPELCHCEKDRFKSYTGTTYEIVRTRDRSHESSRELTYDDFLDIKFETEADSYCISIQKDNLYLVEFWTSNECKWWTFNDMRGFRNTDILNYSGNYFSLKTSFEDIRFGYEEFITALGFLSYSDSRQRGLKFLLAALPESWRFRELGNKIGFHLGIHDCSYTIEPSFVTLFNKWATLSKVAGKGQNADRSTKVLCKDESGREIYATPDSAAEILNIFLGKAFLEGRRSFNRKRKAGKTKGRN